MENDFLLAIRLQEQFDNEYETSLLASDGFEDVNFGQSSKRRKVEPERPLSIVDESWEMLDPSPDVRAMFLEFNDMFFWGKLCGVEVKWSPRMTLCAGLCSYEGRGGLCSIRLSEPLLKLRPRKDLVETLLHEMIHALLFVTQNNRDRDGHGPEFCKHMNRINKTSGTNITVYHSFHDEVDVYRQHWWRCNGPCQNRKPYFGYVKRAMNRAPSSLDPWWEDHKRTCGGTYTKIKEPEGYGKKGKKDGKKDGKSSEKKASGNEKHSNTSTGSGSQDIRNIIPFSGKGFVLGVKSESHISSSPVSFVETTSSSSFSSPKKLLTPSSPASLSSLHSPIKGTSTIFPSIRPATSTVQKPPTKRSVSNTRAFANINGSPVRISKPHSSSSSQRGHQIKQRSIHELFNSTDFRKSGSQSTISFTDTKRDLPTTPNNNPSKSNHSKYPPVLPTNSSPAEPSQSKYFAHLNGESPLGAAGGGERKRLRDDSSSSVSIFDFFQKTLASNSAPSRESINPTEPAMQQRTETPSTSSPHSSVGFHSFTSTSTSSSALMVSCPVCQAKVQESKINEHLDSCLS
ncbi:SprT-like domain-containing protein [Channa argus]|uniref:DNA-dependent metalloprotease SPRTN n=1 Tax=Channa argus TaxID=215402 RepID=A0A6G1QL65_CHAAH|nr:SprT-like domain-containing protein [Channa argus]KAK2889973.1 hypothetical protein Q8A73_018273 [Channa argus]